MTALPFSDAQRAAILALAASDLTTKALAAAIGVTRGAPALLGALYARGIVRYRGRHGSGVWRLTDRGRLTAEEFSKP